MVEPIEAAALSDADLIERCLSHMGKADPQQVLYDCHEVATRLRAAAYAHRAGQEAMRTRAAAAAKGSSDKFDFQAALAECRDSECGSHSGRLSAARAIAALPLEEMPDGEGV